jgi:hypothetical protein
MAKQQRHGHSGPAQRLPKARQLKPVWLQTAALLMEAYASGRADDLQHATRQLRRVPRRSALASLLREFGFGVRSQRFSVLLLDAGEPTSGTP